VSQRDGHPVVAAILDLAMAPLDKVRTRVVPEARGRVLEIGVGTGLNLPHYGAVEELVGVEPDPYMLRRARRRAEAVPFPVAFEPVGAESMPFPDTSFDTVVVTFTLCTIPDPEAALSEIHRVLRPGGEMLFAEHVRARGSAAALMQDTLTPVWKLFAGGCRLNVDAVELVRAAGFAEVEDTPVGRQGWTLSPLVRGRARRG
jgi:ubiquinone/menaquinone biosynthesis C-methylase UbiE